MSDTTVLSVELKANTAGAVGEVGKFTSAMRDATTAATVAGSAQEQLGKDVAITKARQVEATEAVRQAKQALETHNATVAAFGARSEQAAQSAAKLAAAEREATKAANAAAEALAKTAKEAQAVAASEAELSPATKRAAAEISRMGAAADKTAHELNRMERQQKKGSAGFDLMGLAGGKLMAVIGPAALGGSLVALGGFISDAAEKTLQYETAVANLPYTIDAARKSTRGLVTDQALVTAAANASALGVAKTSDAFADLAAATAKLAKPGQDVNGLLNEITGALGRGSSESLNNVNVILTVGEAQRRYAETLGVTVSSLTEEQKATAFKVEGLKAVIAAADATTIAYDGNAAAVVRLKVKVTDAWDAMSRGVANGAGAIVGLVDRSAASLTTMEGALISSALAMDTTWSPAFKNGAADVSSWAAEVVLGAGALDNIQGMLNDPALLSAMDAANAKEAAKRDMLSEEADFAERMQRALVASEAANTAFLDAQAAAAIVYGPAAPDKPKRKGGSKKPQAEVSSLSDRGGDYDAVAQIDVSNAIASAAPEAAAANRAEAEAQRFEEETLRNQRAADMLVERVGLEVEVEAQRAALQDQQLDRERAHARWQATNARTQIARDQALTRAEEVEHRKRVLATQREAAEERKIAEARVATFERIGGATSTLSATIVAAAWEQAAGQKGAIAMMLGDRLKGISIDATVTAAWETAQGVAALAGIYTAALAPGHFTAAAQAAGVAVLAGTAGAALGAGGAAAAGGGAPGGAGGGRPAGPAPTGPAPLPSSNPGGSERERLEGMAVPISYAGRRDEDKGPSIVVNLNGPVTASQGRDIAEQVRRGLTRHKAQGPRP